MDYESSSQALVEASQKNEEEERIKKKQKLSWKSGFNMRSEHCKLNKLISSFLDLEILSF